MTGKGDLIMKFAATLVDNENRGVFITPLSEDAKNSSDIFIGLYEEESDTACGVMAVDAVSDESDESVALSVREMIIDQAYKCPEAERELFSFLQEAAMTAGCSAVFSSEYVPSVDEEERIAFYESQGFFEEEKRLPLYEFELSDVNAKDPVTGLGCLNLSDLSKDQWEAFAVEASKYSFEIMDRDYYDPKTSVFLVDDERSLQAGLLTSIRDGALFIEGIAAYGSDESALINDLVCWGTSAAQKGHKKDENIYMYMFSNRIYNNMLKGVTGGKVRKIGNLVNFTYEVPVSF
jgi:hypothetical protein